MFIKENATAEKKEILRSAMKFLCSHFFTKKNEKSETLFITQLTYNCLKKIRMNSEF